MMNKEPDPAEKNEWWGLNNTEHYYRQTLVVQVLPVAC